MQSLAVRDTRQLEVGDLVGMVSDCSLTSVVLDVYRDIQR